VHCEPHLCCTCILLPTYAKPTYLQTTPLYGKPVLINCKQSCYQYHHKHEALIGGPNNGLVEQSEPFSDMGAEWGRMATHLKKQPCYPLLGKRQPILLKTIWVCLYNLYIPFVPILGSSFNPSMIQAPDSLVRSCAKRRNACKCESWLLNESC
jgi:hypothetical protein